MIERGEIVFLSLISDYPRSTIDSGEFEKEINISRFSLLQSRKNTVKSERMAAMGWAALGRDFHELVLERRFFLLKFSHYSFRSHLF